MRVFKYAQVCLSCLREGIPGVCMYISFSLFFRSATSLSSLAVASVTRQVIASEVMNTTSNVKGEGTVWRLQSDCDVSWCVGANHLVARINVANLRFMQTTYMLKLYVSLYSIFCML